MTYSILRAHTGNGFSHSQHWKAWEEVLGKMLVSGPGGYWDTLGLGHIGTEVGAVCLSRLVSWPHEEWDKTERTHNGTGAELDWE